MFPRLLGLLVVAVLMLSTTTAQRHDVFVDGQVYFVDADCYSRMERVEQVLAHPLSSIRHHDFENFPQGIETHATAPLDWLIAALAIGLKPFNPQALDLAGAWISPLLGLATLALLWLWGARSKMPYRFAMLALLAISPIAAQAFRLGRPDHQSLLLFLLAAGLASEWTLWTRPSRRAAVSWGLAWAVALWTSLYEPLVIFTLLLLLRLILLRRAAFTREWGLAWAVAAGIFGLSILIDGWRVNIPSPEIERYFPNWSRSIAELAHLPPLSAQFPGWLGWLAPALPILLGWRFAKTRDPRLLAMLVLTLAAYALTCWQIRWGSYLALVFAMALPFALAAIPWRGTAWAAFVASLLPLASQWDALLYPEESLAAARDEQRADARLLREAASALISSERTGILAPWWLSPPLAYWSGQPCIAGSSHESLPGTVDTAKFYLATNQDEARAIIARRKVSYVVAYEPSRVLDTSTSLLDEDASRNALGAILYERPVLAPPWLTMVYSNPYFKIYEVKPDGI